MTSALGALQSRHGSMPTKGDGREGPQDDLHRLGAMRDVETEKMMRLPNVRGVAMGKKEANGVEIDQLSLIVFVTKKLDLTKLKAEERIPRKIDPYNSGVPFPTDVIEWPESDASDSSESEEQE